jgi:hypothetical protein
VGNSPVNYVDPLGLSSKDKVPCPKKNEPPEPPSLWDAIKDKWDDLLEVFQPITPVISAVDKVGGGAEALAKGLKVEKEYFNAVCAEWGDTPAGLRACQQRLGIIQ